MSDDTMFGPDRDDEPGLTFQPAHALPPNIIEFHVESCAMHSRSRGWLPAITIRLATLDGAGIVGMMEVTPQLQEMAANMVEAGTRAIVDVKVALENGQLP